MLILERSPEGNVDVKQTWIPGNGRETFGEEALTSLYMKKSPNKVHQAAKTLRRQHAFMHKAATHMTVPEGMVTPSGLLRTPTKTQGFRKVFNINQIAEDQEELKSYATATLNLFYGVPKGLEKVFSGLTVTLPKDYMAEAQEEFLRLESQIPKRGVFAAKKYKPMALKTKAHLGTLPEEFRIKRHITGDPLAGMPELVPDPPPFVPTGRYTAERREQIQADHAGNFMTNQEKRIVDFIFCNQNGGFAWEESEKGHFKPEFFPPVDIPVIPHTPWVLRNIPIPPGIYDEVCKIIKHKLDSGVYEPSNSSYRSRWFCVVKKDGKKLRLVHSLEPLNAVTIAHSGLPPATEELAESFAGRSCGGTLDLFVGYDERLLATASRDMTTFSTPYGALRLKTLPMGWTNSVPIFHDDVTTILKDEIPAFTRPYIDDVPVRGPATRYEQPDGTYETLPGHPEVRRFVWEHLVNMNRIIQRMKYAGGTFSGHKAIICAEEIVVVGHVCTYEGRKPAEERVKVISDWPPCKALTEVRSFLGTAGIFRAFVKDYSKKALPLTRLTKDITKFRWTDEEQESMDILKEAIRTCPMLKPLNYEWPTPITLSVDTSYQAVGFYLSQVDPKDPKKRYFAKFMSLTLNDREARYSQAKRELFGLFRALSACKYYLLGCRKLEIEVDAKYIKGMLSNVDSLANANLQRWAEEILMYHFTLVHVPGKVHGPDGLSRRPASDNDEVVPRPHIEEEDDEVNTFEYQESEGLKPEEQPLDFETFRNDIDSRGGFLQEIVRSPLPDHIRISKAIRTSGLVNVKDIEDWMDIAEFPELTKSKRERLWETYLPKLQPYLESEETTEDEELEKWSKDFFVRNDRLYRTHPDTHLRRVLLPKERIPVCKAIHDRAGHKGQYSVLQLIMKRFWWPGMEVDVRWYVRTCVLCQKRQKRNIKVAPTITSTPGIYERAYVDTFRMPKAGEESIKKKRPSKWAGFNAVTVARCGLTGWPEAKALKEETAEALGEWIFEDILCRWGCIKEIVTDNGPAIKKALVHIEQKYGITGILITAYNKQANGKVERGHWDIRQSLFKVCRGNPEHWPEYLHEVLWAERITIKRSIGTSPFQAVTGCEPIMPMDLQELTWLVEAPDRLVSHSDLIAFRARQLIKHKADTVKLKSKVLLNKQKAAAKFLEDFQNSIPRYKFQTGELVLVRNTRIEAEMNAKFKERFMGPYAVVTRTSAGNYVICELDGTIYKDKIAQFRVIPFVARRNPIDLGKKFFDRLHFISKSVGKTLDVIAKTT